MRPRTHRNEAHDLVEEPSNLCVRVERVRVLAGGGHRRPPGGLGLRLPAQTLGLRHELVVRGVVGVKRFHLGLSALEIATLGLNVALNLFMRKVSGGEEGAREGKKKMKDAMVAAGAPRSLQQSVP